MTDVEFTGGELRAIHVMFDHGSADAGAIQFPMCYDTSALNLVSLSFDTSTFPNPSLWVFSALDTIIDGSGRFLLSAYTFFQEFSLPIGLDHIGEAVFSGTISDVGPSYCFIDTCFYPPAAPRLAYTSLSTGLIYYPDWTPVSVTSLPGVCGDFDGSGTLTPADAYLILNYLGSAIPPPPSCWIPNVNSDSAITSSDGFYLMHYFGEPESWPLDCQPCEF
jgi:hypothetical protein